MKYLAMIWTGWKDEQEFDVEEAMRYREFAAEAAGAGVLQCLAERIGAGVLTSAAGRGSLPEDHPQCLGFFPVESPLLVPPDCVQYWVLIR